MLTEFSRTELLLGREKMARLEASAVIVFGVGGVGSYAIEALARSGIGRIAIVDNDTVSITNINRQLIATHKTVGLFKVDVEKERIFDINPRCVVEPFNCFYDAQNDGGIDLSRYDYIIDAIDSVPSKLFLIESAARLKVRIISCMGTGNKRDPCAFRIADIGKTETCPLARVMRRELRLRGVKKLKVLFSTEQPHPQCAASEEEKRVPASIAFVPSVAGLIIAGAVINEIAEGVADEK